MENVIGPMVLGIAMGLHQSWRNAFFILAVLTVLLLGMLWKYRKAIPTAPDKIDEPIQGFKQGLGHAIAALNISTRPRYRC